MTKVKNDKSPYNVHAPRPSAVVETRYATIIVGKSWDNDALVRVTQNFLFLYRIWKPGLDCFWCDHCVSFVSGSDYMQGYSLELDRLGFVFSQNGRILENIRIRNI